MMKLDKWIYRTVPKPKRVRNLGNSFIFIDWEGLILYYKMRGLYPDEKELFSYLRLKYGKFNQKVYINFLSSDYKGTLAYSTQQNFNDMLKSVGFRVSVSDQYWTDKLGDVYAKGTDVKIATDMVLNTHPNNGLLDSIILVCGKF